MGKTYNYRLTLALAKTFFIMHVGLFTNAQVLRVKNGTFRDTTNVYAPTITGGTVVGDALVFNSAAGNCITMEDKGRASFVGGFTLSSEVWFDETPNYFFSMKFGSYCISFMSGGKMTSNWMTFPSEPIFTTVAGQFNYYPVGTELLNGYATLPLKQWVKLELNYDEGTGVTTTKINGVVDRVLYRYRGNERVMNQPNHSFKFFENGKNVRIREIKFQNGRPTVTPTLNVNANALPYLNKVLVSFDQIDPNLKFPMNALVYMFRPGALTTLHTVTLKSAARLDTALPMPAWNGNMMNVQVKVAGLERNFPMVNRAAPSPFNSGRYPIVAYHAAPQDFKQLAALGFSVIQNDLNVMGGGGDPAANIQRSLDSAKKYNLGVYVVANVTATKQGYVARFKDHPNLYGWYLADEPGGADLLETMRDYNNAVKMIDSNSPTMIMMNNFNRLTGLDCDIIGVDPFPLPNISLRMIDDATKAGIRASKGNKPVLTLFPHYNSLIPTLAELKCMSWLAVIAGAHGIGIFEWDHRTLNTPNAYYIGNSPTQVAIIGSVFNEMRTYEWLLSAKNVDCNTGNLAIHACTKAANGKNMLLLANDSRKSESATFVAGGKTVSIAMAPYEVRIVDLNTVSSQGGRFAIQPQNNLAGNWENPNWLDYRIQFKSSDINEKGEIEIRSQISPEVDLTKLELTGSSHPLQMEIENELEGTVLFKLNRIPFSLSVGPDQSNSGFIEFKVPVRPETSAGTEILHHVTLFTHSSEPVELTPTQHTYQPETSGNQVENKIQVAFSVYPNPGHQWLNLESESDGLLEIRDMAGRSQTREVKRGQNQFQVNDFRSGIYVLVLNGQAQKWVKE